jgi:hypothetical protein
MEHCWPCRAAATACTEPESRCLHTITWTIKTAYSALQLPSMVSCAVSYCEALLWSVAA